MDLGTFSLLGYGVGLVASIFFHRPIRYVAAGVGGSYGIVQNQQSFHRLVWLFTNRNYYQIITFFTILQLYLINFVDNNKLRKLIILCNFL